MTTYPSVLPDLAVPPADERSPNMLTTTPDEVRVVDVPLLALTTRDVIRYHPDNTDEPVAWRVVRWETGEDTSVTYTVRGDTTEHTHAFEGPAPWVRVQAPSGEVAR